jgi:hypothetical protein
VEWAEESEKTFKTKIKAEFDVVNKIQQMY